ncbi:Protein roadkill [Hordeum vulgare]|nr:Protein roadkill [Hordeum vulgare]
MTMTALLSALRGAGRRQITASTVAARQATGSHVLRVDGFTRVREKAANGTAVQSSRFGVGGHDWRIQCYPNGDTEMAEGHLSLYLIHEGQAKTGDATATFKISLLDKAWEPCRSGSQEEHRFDVDHGWGWNRFMRLEDLDKEKHLKDDCLSVLCDVTVDLGLRADDHTDEAAEAEELKSAPPPFDLRGVALAEALWNTQAADVMIHLGDGQKMAAHRWVLEARSPVLKADLALASTTDESITKLRVDGMNADVCKELLQFIYTDSPPRQMDQVADAVVEGLLVAADRYELEKLKVVCEDALCKMVDARSVAATLALAERYRCPKLTEVCIKFLSYPHNLKAVMASDDGFEQLKTGCPSALLELLVKNMPMPTHDHDQTITSTSSHIVSYSDQTKSEQRD